MTWTDIHSHILPGFDDGASDDHIFLQMARIAVEGGTSVMVATPHCDLESYSFEPSKIIEAVGQYNDRLKESGIRLILVPGAEVRVNTGLHDRARDGDLMDLCLGKGSRYILVELPLLDMPMATEDILFQIQLRGITPIVAHPERNRHLVDNPATLKSLVDRGAEIQVNAGSLVGMFGDSARRVARGLIREDLARLVASDAHSPSGRNPDLSGAARVIRKLLGEGASDTILRVNPGLVLEGEELAGSSKDHSRKRNRFRRRPPA